MDSHLKTYLASTIANDLINYPKGAFMELDIPRQTGKTSAIVELCETGDMIFTSNYSARKSIMTRLLDLGKSEVEVDVFDDSFAVRRKGTESSLVNGGIVWCDECSDKQIEKILEFVNLEQALNGGMIIHIISLRTRYIHMPSKPCYIDVNFSIPVK